jgi:membrane protease YdiL (CAAX protease family)
MVTQLFYLCLLVIAASGILQSPRIIMNSLLKRILGTLVFSVALIPLLFNSNQFAFQKFGLNFIYHPWVMFLSILISITLIIMNGYAAGSKNNMAVYPQIREPIWTLQITLRSSIAWTVYLTIYEIIFRGIFFHTSILFIGFWPAVVLNIITYSLAHLLKNKREAILSIPFGFLMIYLTWDSGSCWYAVFIHVILALSHEWSSICANPGMRFDFSSISNKKLK